MPKSFMYVELLIVDAIKDLKIHKILKRVTFTYFPRNIDIEMLSHLKRATFLVARSHRALMFSLVLYIQYEKVHRPVRHGYAA